MVVDSLLRDHEAVCDLRVREAVGEQSEHLELPARQPARVLLRRLPGAPGHAGAPLAKLPGHHLGGRPCAEAGQDIQSLLLEGLVVGLAESDRPLVRAAGRLPRRDRLVPRPA